MSREPPKGARRALRLAGLTARVAGSVASTQLRRMFLGEERAEAARRATLEGLGEGIAATLGELKGAVMKVGQMASIAQDLFPAEIQQALRRLQREAPPIPFDVIARQLVAELGRPLADCFDDIDPTPFAAASIGQVHRARIGSRELVVKVQYPGVAQSVESDVAHLRRTLALVTLANIPRSALDAVTAEVAARLREELDYTAEAANARFFAGALADDPRVVVPSVVDDRSSAGVLTLTHEPGIPLGDLSEAQLPAERIDELGRTLVEVLARQLVELRTLHADPNPANFAARADGRLVIYDFGCVKRLSPELLTSYVATIAAALESRWPDVDAGLRRLGALRPSAPVLPAEFYAGWRDLLARPLLHDAPFDYGRSDIHQEVLRRVPGFLREHARWFQPPAELIYVDRVIAGHYANLQRLGATINARRVLLPFLGLAP